MRYLCLLSLAAALAPARSLENVQYGQNGSEPLTMDGYIPEGTGKHPAAILVHGGAWVSGDKARSVRPLFKPLSDGGMAWFSINYRLARGNSPDALISIEGLTALRNASDDVRAAVDYVRAHAEEWNIDPQRIALIGESAGAHLASMAALKTTAQPVQAVVAFYSPSDLVKLAQTSPRIPDILRNAVKGTPLEAILMGALRQLSPQSLITKDAPPFLMIHGTADTLVPFEQSESMCGALRSVGASCELFAVPGAGHGINFWEGEPSMMAYKEKMITWLKATLRLE
ncbi:MAG: alpha/beta hydrolase [Acidobacteriota bacterium]